MTTRGVFFGWWVALAFMVMAFVSSGIRFAASMAGSVAAASALSAEVFGRLSLGAVFGTMFLLHQTGSALGSWLSGARFETTGGYGAAFGVASALLLAAAGLRATIGERPRATARVALVAGGK